MPLTRQTCACHFTSGLSDISDWSRIRVVDVDDCSSTMDSPFDLDQEDSPPNHEPIQPQFQVVLKDLARVESAISQI